MASDTTAGGRPRLTIPPSVPASREELARRQAAVAEIRRLREEIGPLDLTLEELLGREDEDDNG